MTATGPDNVVARRVTDDLIAFSGEIAVPKYMKFFLVQKVAETRRFVNRMRDDVIRSCIAQMTAVIAKLQATEDQDEYLVKLSKRRAFWSLNEDILKIMDSDNQYAVSIKENTPYPCLHSPKTTKEQDLYAKVNLDNSTNNVLIPLDSWTSGLLEYKLPLSKLMPTIEEGEVIEEFRTKDEDLDTGIDDYPSYCDHDKKIHIDCAHNLNFSCMIGFEFVYVNFFPLLYVNVMSKKFHNSIMKEKMVYKGDNVVGALMNVPIFVGTFSVITDFGVLEDISAYRDEGMGDIIVGKPFLREIGIKAKRFEGMITIYNGNDEVTYQMVRSHPRFKRQTNEKCNKIPPLLKVSEEDEMNGFSHEY
ncbi:hypothetical protein Tco_1042934 [Tanacetum coccineum]|uniref:DNA-directed RNA polymerase n=1 Tax=Tanacetum coccineum TaxID=301880 RepID=A0ABQ5GL78_9ASTR